MYVPTCDILKRSFDIPIVSCCPLYNYPDVDFVAVELVSMCWFALQGAMVFSIHRAMFDYAEHVDDASNVTCPYHGWHMRTAMYLMCMYIVHMRFESILKYMSHLIYHLWHIYIYISIYIYATYVPNTCLSFSSTCQLAEFQCPRIWPSATWWAWHQRTWWRRNGKARPCSAPAELEAFWWKWESWTDPLPTPFIIMGAPRNHTNIPLICLVVFPILAVSGR